MSKEGNWKPDSDAALKALIRQTIDEMGEADAATLPHRVRRRLKEQAASDADIDRLVDQVLAERRRP